MAFVPIDIRLPTGEARAALHRMVPLRDAVYNAGHAAATVVALTSEPGLLTQTLGDRLHQARASGLVPAVKARLRSTAGRRTSPSASRAPVRRCSRSSSEGVSMPDPGDGWQVLRLDVATTGVEVAEG